MKSLLKKVLWSFRYPWPRSAIDGRIRPLRISVCPKERFYECLALYERNEPHGVPSDHRERYLSDLREGRFLPLIAEEGEQVVGTFGIHYEVIPGAVCLCYILVDPENHRRGIGTTMFLAALALLPANQPEFTLWIAALPTASDFYYRLGFQRLGQIEHSSGQLHQIATLPITSTTIASCRTWLTGAGVYLPTSYEIPQSRAA